MTRLKMGLLRLLVWFIVIVIFLVIDNQFALSDTYDWYAVVGILFPVLCAIFIPLPKDGSGSQKSKAREDDSHYRK